MIVGANTQKLLLHVFYFFCRTKSFVRWMNGTCIETPPQKIEGEDEPYVFTFFTDISTNPEVIDVVQTIQTSMKNTLTTLTRYLNRWKKYRLVWKQDKVGTDIIPSEFMKFSNSIIIGKIFQQIFRRQSKEKLALL
jgi:hypothetical protein